MAYPILNMLYVPRPPLQDWEREDMINLEVQIFSWKGTRAIVRMHLPLDRNVQRLQAATRGLIRDVKHSRNWRCEFCGRFSRESQVRTDFSVGEDVSPPRMAMYMDHICDHDHRKCFADLEGVHIFYAAATGREIKPLPRPPRKPHNMIYPRAGSCVGCQKDSSLLGVQQRCERCNLSRYCSIKCQKDDWKRHKVTCKRICSVSYDVPGEAITGAEDASSSSAPST